MSQGPLFPDAPESHSELSELREEVRQCRLQLERHRRKWSRLNTEMRDLQSRGLEHTDRYAKARSLRDLESYTGQSVKKELDRLERALYDMTE